VITRQNADSLSLLELLETDGAGLAGSVPRATVLLLGQTSDLPPRETTGTPLDNQHSPLQGTTRYNNITSIIK
jgi:hypothetical protein